MQSISDVEPCSARQARTMPNSNIQVAATAVYFCGVDQGKQQ